MSDHVDKAEAWDASRASWQKGYDRGVAEAAAENAALRQIISDAAAELERVYSERPYIIGCNDGFETAVEQAALVAGDYAGKQSPIVAGIRALSTPTKPKGQADE